MYEGDFFLTWDKTDDELEAVFTVADALRYMHSGFVGDTGVAAVDQLLTRGGLNSMTGTITLMLLSLTLAGALAPDREDLRILSTMRSLFSSPSCKLYVILIA